MNKGFFIVVKRNLLDPKHIHKMRVNQKTSAIWCYLWFLDKITKIVKNDKDENIGIVLGGKPIKLQDICDDLGMNIKTARKMYHTLKAEGYITNARTPYGNIISVTKAFKIFGLKTDLPHHGSSDTQSGRSNIQNVVGLGTKSGRSNKTRQLDKTIRQYKPKGLSDEPTIGVIPKLVTSNTDDLLGNKLKPKLTRKQPNPEVEAVVREFEKAFELKLKRVRYQRSMAFNLIRRYDFNRVMGVIKAARAVRDERYAPQITDLQDLWEKWDKLESFYRRKQQDQSSKVAIITEDEK